MQELPGSDRFTEYLEGGMWCWDENSCQRRNEMRPFFKGGLGKTGYPNYCNRTDWDGHCPTRELDKDMWSTDAALNPEFAGATHVFVPYCSSDSWSGNRDASDSTYGWAFKGKEIVRQVFEALHEKHGLAAASAVYFTGVSAGGMGVLVNADSVGAYVKKVAPQAIYAADMNAGWFTSLKPLGHCEDVPDCPQDQPAPAAPTTVADQCRLGESLWGGVVDESCAKAMGERDAWKCYLGDTGYRHVKEKLFVSEMQTDCWQLSWYGDAPATNRTSNLCWHQDKGWPTAVQKSFATKLRVQLQAELSQVKRGIFSPVCYIHEVNWAQRIERAGSGCGKLQALQSFVFAKPVDKKCGERLLDQCTGLECSKFCMVSSSDTKKNDGVR